jgi:hypothetical protein
MPEILSYIADMKLILSLIGLVVLGIAGVILWGIRSDAKSEPDGGPTGPVNTAPSCYGDFPRTRIDVQNTRGCLSCIYNFQCMQRTKPVNPRDRSVR